MNKSAKAPATKDASVVFGGGASTFRKRPVHAALRQSFSSVWFHKVPEDATGSSIIVPDGCADIVWCNGTLRFGGPDRRVKLEPVPPGICVIGLQFQPGVAHHWLRTSLLEMVGTRLPLESFWGQEARGFSDWVAEAGDPDELAQRIEYGLRQRQRITPSVDSLAKALFHAIKDRRNYSVSVTRQLVGQFGFSERTLRRRCYEAFGFGPKLLDRILRFQRYIELSRCEVNAASADLASTAGYADQAHLAREARALSGLTPSELRKHLSF